MTFQRSGPNPFRPDSEAKANYLHYRKGEGDAGEDKGHPLVPLCLPVLTLRVQNHAGVLLQEPQDLEETTFRVRSFLIIDFVFMYVPKKVSNQVTLEGCSGTA